MSRGVLCVAFVALFIPATGVARTDVGWELSLDWPADGTITSPFGQDGYRWHPGLDIGTLRSLDVRTAAAGVVAQTGYVEGYSGYGNVVLVIHREGFSTLYAHLSQPLVRRGDEVSSGDRIGIAGCTGWCTGTHLHFELRLRGQVLDPSPFLS